MLSTATSPIISASANASPTGFRHGAVAAAASPPVARSPRTSQRSSAPASRRPSISSSAPSRARHHHAPPAAPSSETSASSSHDPQVSEHSPQSVPQPMTMETLAPTDSSASTAARRSDVSQVPQPPDLPQPPNGVNGATALSPNKRRGSPCQHEHPLNASMEEDVADQTHDSAQASKRARPAERPPKILPTRYEKCAVEDIVELIAHMLAELIATNDAIKISHSGLTRFHSRTAPGISVRDYLHRLAKHATLTPPLLLAMVYYIDRLCALYPDFSINTLTVHRFLITAATVASKGLSDSFWNNTTYARVGGVRLAELKLLEVEFLYRVEWRIVPNPEVLDSYFLGLVQRMPGYELESGEGSGGTHNGHSNANDEQEDGVS